MPRPPAHRQTVNPQAAATVEERTGTAEESPPEESFDAPPEISRPAEAPPNVPRETGGGATWRALAAAGYSPKHRLADAARIMGCTPRTAAQRLKAEKTRAENPPQAAQAVSPTANSAQAQADRQRRSNWPLEALRSGRRRM